MRQSVRVVLGALYRPYDLLDDFKTRGATLWIALGISVLIMVGSGVITIRAMLLLQPQLSPELTVLILFLPVIPALMSFASCMTTLSQVDLGSFAAYSYWFVISQVMVTPYIMLGWIAVNSLAPSTDGSLTFIQIVLLMILFSVAIGKLVSVVMVLHQRASWTPDRRWLLVLGMPVLALALWMTPQAWGTYWLALGVVLPAIAWAQLRVGAWLWQATWASILVSAAAITGRDDWSATYFPASLDQTRLLPLPWTIAMLRQQSRKFAYQTARWIIRLADQPNDRWLVQRFVVDLPAAPWADAIIFWLSVDPVGQKLIHSVTEARPHVPAAIRAYTHIGHVVAPGGWRLALEQHAGALLTAAPTAEAAWMPALIRDAQQLLEARRWEHVRRNITHDGTAVEARLAALRTQIHETFGARAEVVPEATWPIQLLDTVVEHVAFLQELDEQTR